MNKLYRLIFIIFLIYISANTGLARIKFGKLFNFHNMKDEHRDSYKFESIASSHEPLNIVYISDINLYPSPIQEELVKASQNFIQDPITSLDLISKSIFKTNFTKKEAPKNTKVLYNESQVLLQEAIREIIKMSESTTIDMVLFGGNQVFNNEHYSLFQDIAYDLQKFSIPFYTMVGSGENSGSNQLNKLIEDRFYMLIVKDTNVVIIDNAKEELVPKYLPEEATEQYLWFKKMLADLNDNRQELYLFSYRPLSTKTIELINSYPQLNLKLVAHSSQYHFDNSQENKNLRNPFIHKSNPVIISNSSLSTYPCSYSTITRDHKHKLKISNIKVGLEDIRALAKQRYDMAQN